jgi:ribonuclease D
LPSVGWYAVGVHVDDHRWVDTRDALAELATALAQTRVIALDTESNSMFVYRERICLVQLNLIGHTPALYAIDPLAFAPGEAIEGLAAWFAGPHHVLVHGGEYDVAVLKRELGSAPTDLFDTHAAALLLGLPQTGYANLCGELLDVKITKEHQQFNWGRRPVPPGPRAYALDDVRYLPALADVVRERVRAADIEEEVAIACQAVAMSAPHEVTNDTQRFWRIAGSARLSREALSRLASLLAWREEEAERRDQPPGRLVSKASLLSLAKDNPATASELGRYGLSRRLLSGGGDALLAALATPGEVPERPSGPRPDPDVERRRQRLKTWRDKEAQRRGVTPQVVLPTRALDALSWGERDLEAVPQLGDKRVRLYGEAIRKMIE